MAALEGILYKGEGPEINVREEFWYPRYFMSNETVLKNIYRKNSSVVVKMMGIQGDLTFGKRTR